MIILMSRDIRTNKIFLIINKKIFDSYYTFLVAVQMCTSFTQDLYDGFHIRSVATRTLCAHTGHFASTPEKFETSSSVKISTLWCYTFDTVAEDYYKSDIGPPEGRPFIKIIF